VNRRHTGLISLKEGFNSPTRHHYVQGMAPELVLVLMALALLFVGGVARTWPQPRPPELPRYTDWWAPVFPDPPKEPWRHGPHGATSIVVGVELLAEIADPRRLQELAAVETQYLLDLEGDIKENGIQEPLLLIVDGLGRIAMKEGHHRTIVATRIGMTGLPVRLRTSEGRVRYGRPLSETMVEFLQTAVREAQR
jgi:hypothetical protein